MFRRLHIPANTRRGVILLVVLALLTLFAIVGISFVLYANQQASSSRNVREGEAPPQPDMDPELLLSYFLNQLIYDADDVNGVYSALRGHSLGRNMYGYNCQITNANGQTQIQVLDNTLPFSGVGRIHTDNASANDEFFKINYTYFKSLGDAFIRDPERLPKPNKSWRTNSQQANTDLNYFAFSTDYTYPDVNNMFLGALKASGFTHPDIATPVPPGALLAISFHREVLGYDQMGQPVGFGNLWSTVRNPNWGTPTNLMPQARLWTLRPRPIDQKKNPLDPMEVEEFPYPEDGGGDVKNLINSPGYFYKDSTTGKYQLANNDSIWIDLGAPVMVAPDGTKFKPLFAPLILDLDGRINLNVHGNMKGRDNQGNIQHASDQGWGPWEVNLQKVLPANDPVTGRPEWFQLFQGVGGASAAVVYGRYGQDTRPHSGYAGNSATPGTSPHLYSQVDFDGYNEVAPNGPTTPISMGDMQPYEFPVGSGTFFCPTFLTYFNRNTQQPYVGFGNGTPAERTDHPLLYNYFTPQSMYQMQGRPAVTDTAFTASNMEALLRYSDTGSPGLTSDLFRLCPTNLVDAKVRNLVTSHSFGLDRPAVVPWVWDPSPSPTDQANYQAAYQLPADTSTQSFPSGALPNGLAIPFPDLSKRGQEPRGSEFRTQDWRAMSAAIGKVDLNRYLTPYPINDPTRRFNNTEMAQANQADLDRIYLARDIYMRLVVATGAYNPWNHSANQPTPGQLRALRWLAQLAVNIVDFIDSDDIMTGFDWGHFGDAQFVAAVGSVMENGALVVPNTWVFGTEVPRLVINEIYVEYNQTNYGQQNQPPEFDVDVWTELYNPLPAEAAGADPAGGVAYLQFVPRPDTNPIYELDLVNLNPNTTAIRKPYNVLGDPDTGQNGGYKQYNGQDCRLRDWVTGQAMPQNTVQPSSPGGQYSGPNQGNKPFYLVGPRTDFPQDMNATPPPPKASWAAPANQHQMTYHLRMQQGQNPKDNDLPPTVMLRRLANPYKAFNPANNPYVTVDYQITVQGQIYNATTGDPNAVPIEQRHSWGRVQPFAGYQDTVYWKKLLPGGGGTFQNTKQPQHTFFYQNAIEGPAPQTVPQRGANQTLSIPFDPLIHANRQLISPMELLEVSAYKPHELTQQFRTTAQNLANTPAAHRAPWFDQRARLYRVFEFLETGSRAAGVVPGGRVPGLVNINTVYDEEIIQALLDAQPSNHFATTDVTNVFTRMMKVRSPGSQAPYAPTANDRPFRSAATGYSIVGDLQHPRRLIGINDTPLRCAPNADPPTGVDRTPDAGGQFQAVQPRVVQMVNPNNGSDTDTGSYPFLKEQMITKLFNNVTTRSNVFAVWVTVGFFKVTDDTASPPKLGAEIGKAEGRNIRHRMFAIVDRSNLSLRTPYNPSNMSYQPDPGTPGGIPILLKGRIKYDLNPPQVELDGAQFDQATNTLKGTYDGIPWRIQVGTALGVDYPTVSASNMAGDTAPLTQEPNPAVVQQIIPDPNGGPPSVLIPLTRRHNTTVVIQVPYTNDPSMNPAPVLNNYPGNPGPQSRFNPRDYPWVVRHFSILN